jgi:hypothetical protein
MCCSIASADNLTTAMVGSPEYPLISRTGTHGLPLTSESDRMKVRNTSGGGALGAHRPGQMADQQHTGPTRSR